jgi:hypothetical protein
MKLSAKANVALTNQQSSQTPLATSTVQQKFETQTQNGEDPKKADGLMRLGCC